MSRKLTYKDLEKAFEVLDKIDTPSTIVIMPAETAKTLKKFLKDDRDYYRTQPWYRKLIYHWNMWRTKV